jgi:hypothetical protein
MGDRAQVAIKQDEGLVYLYTHWHGSDLQTIVRRALARKQRWNDEEYLARIIFCEMIKDYEAGETGFGIGLDEHGDSQHPLIIVDPEEQTVTIGAKVFKFEKYITMRARVEG